MAFCYTVSSSSTLPKGRFYPRVFGNLRQKKSLRFLPVLPTGEQPEQDSETRRDDIVSELVSREFCRPDHNIARNADEDDARNWLDLRIRFHSRGANVICGCNRNRNPFEAVYVIGNTLSMLKGIRNKEEQEGTFHMGVIDQIRNWCWTSIRFESPGKFKYFVRRPAITSPIL